MVMICCRVFKGRLVLSVLLQQAVIIALLRLPPTLWKSGVRWINDEVWRWEAPEGSWEVLAAGRLLGSFLKAAVTLLGGCWLGGRILYPTGMRAPSSMTLMTLVQHCHVSFSFVFRYALFDGVVDFRATSRVLLATPWVRHLR